MKTKTVGVLLFIVLFVVGAMLINRNLPQDDVELTTPYSAEVNIFAPAEAVRVEKFDASGAAVAVVGMEAFRQASSSPGSRNFVSAAFIGGA